MHPSRDTLFFIGAGFVLALVVMYLLSVIHFAGVSVEEKKLGETFAYRSTGKVSSEQGYASKGSYGGASTVRGKEEFPVKEGYVVIESDNSSRDLEIIRGKTEELNGFLESYMMNEDKFEKRIFVTLRVPSERFDELFYWILANFDVKSSDTRLYRLDVTFTHTEAEILRDALNDLEVLRKRAEQEKIDAELVETISRIVEKEIYFREKLSRYELSYADAEDRSKYSTVSLEILEKKPILIFDRDFWREFMLGVKESVERIFSALKLLFLDIPAHIFSLVYYVVYWTLTLSAAVLVISIVYLFGRKIKERIG